MDEIEKRIREEINRKNNEPISDFEGYSPNEMDFIFYDPLHSNSPIEMRKLDQNAYLKIPIFNQVKFLLDLIQEEKELKLTARGFLPTKIVAELYGKGYIKDYFIETGISKLHKEADVKSIHLAKILVELSTFVKKRNNKLTLTKKGTDQIGENHLIFQDIFQAFTTKFDWSYFDYYSNEESGQLGFAFTLILWDKYGGEYRNPEFYADKYVKAFNLKSENTELRISDNPKNAYIIRTFERFLDYFGFTKYENENEDSKVKKTEIFNEIFKIRPHKNIDINPLK